MNGRTEIWGIVAASLAKRPILGYGFHAFWLGLSGESGSILTSGTWYPGFAHNGFLELWLELGVVGVGTIGIIIFRCLSFGLNALRAGVSEGIGWYMGVLVISLICNVTEGTLMSAANLGWLVFVLARVGIKRHRTQQTLAQPNQLDGETQFAPWPIVETVS